MLHQRTIAPIEMEIPSIFHRGIAMKSGISSKKNKKFFEKSISHQIANN
jgi:hypothetical protein